MALHILVFPSENVEIRDLFDELCLNFEHIDWLKEKSTGVEIRGCPEYIGDVLGLVFNSAGQLVKFSPKSEELASRIRFIHHKN